MSDLHNEQPHPEEEPVNDQPVTPPMSEADLPPEAQGPMHGGPLGCCMGTLAGLFLASLAAAGLFIWLFKHPFVDLTMLPVVLIGAILGGIIGWRIGKKIYREYDPPVLKTRKK